MSSDLCRSFQKIASWVWQNIELAQRTGLKFSEETITESILLQLATCHPGKVKIHAFTKPEEGINGSDWEWWIGENGNWLGMRVQAKRIKLPSETFAPLQRYKSPKGSTYQIDNLLSRARSDGLNAAYCLYFASKKWPAMRAWPTYAFLGGGPLSPQGCLIADASAVKTVGKDTLAALAPVTVPWHLLVCHCSAGALNRGGLADAAYSVLDASRGLTPRSGDSTLIDAPLVPPQNDLPLHMRLLRENGEEVVGASKEMLWSYAKERNLKGFLLIDGDE